MANKRNQTAKKAARAAENAAKNNPKVFFSVIAILLVIVIIAGLLWYFLIYKKKSAPPAFATDEISIHFLELGNKYVGDCTLVKIGNTEVLIDAGSKNNSASTLISYINKYCTDGTLEYVIATHAHEDHIGAFYSTSSERGIFESFDCKTIIDFAKTKKENKPTSVYGKYVAARDAEVNSGAKHYTALECWNNENGAQRTYALAENVTMSILYQKYYEEFDSGTGENNYSVCVLITQGIYNYLFTGDLEEKGEISLVESNSLPQCKLYKGGHHGSKTSSSDKLLSVIKPETVCICTCAGTPEYPSDASQFNPENAFPAQATIDRLSKYTDKIYVTSLAVDIVLEPKKSWNVVSMNGNIVVRSNGIDFSVTGSNRSLILKETEWFKANRTWSGV